MKIPIFKLFVAMNCPPENDRKSLLIKRGRGMKRTFVTFGFALAAFALQQRAVVWGQELGGSIVGNPSCVTSIGPSQDVLRDVDLGVTKLFGEVICVFRGTGNNLFAIGFIPGGTPSRSGAIIPVLGGPTRGNPSCAKPGLSPVSLRPRPDPDPSVICAVRGPNNVLLGIRFSLSGFFGNPDEPQRISSTSTLLPIGQDVVGNPSCAGTESEEVICAVRGPNNVLLGIRFNPGLTNSGLQALPGEALKGTALDIPVLGDPSCATAPELSLGRAAVEKVVCAMEGPDNELLGIGFNPDPRFFIDNTGFRHLGGNIRGIPSCATTENTFDGLLGQVLCAVRGRGPNNTLLGIRFSPGLGPNFPVSRSLLQELGRPVLGNPSCAGTGFLGSAGVLGGLAACIVKGGDNGPLFVQFFPRDPSDPSSGLSSSGLRPDGIVTPENFETLGGFIIGDPSCVAFDPEIADLVCGVKGPNGALFVIRFES